MKIAIISDIHGNHYALDAVLKEAETLEVDHLFILGDLVGYYYHPEIVVQYLKDWSKDMIKGNHEDLMKEASENEEVSRKIIDDYGFGIELALERLDKKTRDELINLKVRKSIKLDNIKFELCHGSPWDVNIYIYPDSDIEILKQCAIEGADFVFMGHTHRHFIYHHKNIIIANVGSVGQNREKGGLASWVLMKTTNRTLTFKHTPYSTHELIKEIKMQDKNNQYIIDVLKK